MGQDETDDAVKAAKKSVRDARWERELEMRFDMLGVQHGETMALHETFDHRRQLAVAVEEARLADHKSVVKFREEALRHFDRQSLALERIANALEKR